MLTAAEMKEMTSSLLDQLTKDLFKRIEDLMSQSTKFKITIPITEEEEKIIYIVEVKLKDLGYEIEHTPGFTDYDDKWVSGQLDISWD